MSILIIAEIGVNHNGVEEMAYRLIDAAASCGADVAKFQLYKPELLAPEGEKRDMLQGMLLPREAYIRLAAYCRQCGIKFACTAFDADSLEFLLTYTKMAFVKISSGKWGDRDLLKAAYNSDLPVFQSCLEPPDPEAPIPRYIWKYLHVVPEYPTPPERANLLRVTEPWCSGLSDHSGEIYAPLAAVAMGASIIECHLTMDKKLQGPDHLASLDPVQFAQMVKGVRIIEKGLR